MSKLSISDTQTMSQSPRYLSVNEQEEVISKLRTLVRSSPTREKLFFEHGDIVAAGTLVASSIVFWRAGFKGFNLSRYNKHRLTTLCLTCISAAQGAIVHTKVLTGLTDLYCNESYSTYGFKTVLAHQCGLITGLLCGTGLTFFMAHGASILPIPNAIHTKENRKVAFDYFKSRIKPYAKSIGITFLVSSAFMYVVGLYEFKQSRDLLAKMNRKSICLRED